MLDNHRKSSSGLPGCQEAFAPCPQHAYNRRMRHKRSRSSGSSASKRHPKSARPDKMLIYGGHAVKAALQNPERRISKLSVTENAAHRFKQLLEPFANKVKIVRATELEHLVGADAVHQGLVLETAPLPERSLEQFLENRQNRLVFVILDQITDPHNVGAILRSCSAFGVDAVIVPARNSVEISSVLAKAASGAIEHVPLLRVTNLVRALKTLKQAHVSVVGFDSGLSDDFNSIRNLERIALVFGAEGKGMRRLTRETCDHLVRLNMPGAIKSLNVSNACAVALYALTIK